MTKKEPPPEFVNQFRTKKKPKPTLHYLNQTFEEKLLVVGIAFVLSILRIQMSEKAGLPRAKLSGALLLPVLVRMGQRTLNDGLGGLANKPALKYKRRRSAKAREFPIMSRQYPRRRSRQRELCRFLLDNRAETMPC